MLLTRVIWRGTTSPAGSRRTRKCFVPLLPGARFAPGFVDGEQGEPARIVDRSGKLIKLGGHCRAGGPEEIDQFAVVQRLRCQEPPLRLDLMSAVLRFGKLFLAVRKPLLQEVALSLKVTVSPRGAARWQAMSSIT
jgi:hypothetical protein